MTSDLQQTRYDQLVRRVGGIIGPGSKVSEALPELFPVLDVERVPGELLRLSGTKLGFATFEIAAGAAQFPGAQLFNPVGSGQLVTITRAYFADFGDTEVRWGRSDTELASNLPNAPRLRDFREVFPDQPVARYNIDTALGAPVDAFGLTRLLANTPFVLDDPNGVAILSPGTGFHMGSDTAQHTITVTFNWRERVALDSELLFP